MMPSLTCKRIFLIVLDSFGIGELPDAAAYGDAGSNTLASISHSPAFRADTLQRLGLFNIEGVDCREGVNAPLAAYGRCVERSKGKDTTTGHWEIAGLVSDHPLPTYPDGFPAEVLDAFTQATGRGVLCNRPYSGTQVILDYGRAHLETGKLIVYTSADSVFQIAAHESLIPPEELYEICRKARAVLTGKHAVGRVIARPFTGVYPHFTRTANRHDFFPGASGRYNARPAAGAGPGNGRRGENQRYFCWARRLPRDPNQRKCGWHGADKAAGKRGFSRPLLCQSC